MLGFGMNIVINGDEMLKKPNRH